MSREMPVDLRTSIWRKNRQLSALSRRMRRAGKAIEKNASRRTGLEADRGAGVDVGEDVDQALRAKRDQVNHVTANDRALPHDETKTKLKTMIY
jgi:hypothetical protein